MRGLIASAALALVASACAGVDMPDASPTAGDFGSPDDQGDDQGNVLQPDFSSFDFTGADLTAAPAPPDFAIADQPAFDLASNIDLTIPTAMIDSAITDFSTATLDFAMPDLMKPLDFSVVDSAVADLSVRDFTTPLDFTVAADLAPPGPQTVVSGAPGIYGFAMDPSNYYVSLSTGTIEKIDRTTNNVTVLLTGENYPFGLTVDSTSIYWTTYGDGFVKRMDLSGMNRTNLVTSQTGPLGIAVNATDLYWVNFNGVEVMKMHLPTGPVTTIYAGPSGSYYGVALDASAVYFSDQTSGTIQKIPFGSSTPTLLLSGLGSPKGIAVDASNLYFATVTDEKIWANPLGTTMLQQLAAGQLSPKSVVVDTQYVYWAENVSGTVRRIAK